jgi:hypothetical protein
MPEEIKKGLRALGLSDDITDLVCKNLYILQESIEREAVATMETLAEDYKLHPGLAAILVFTAMKDHLEVMRKDLELVINSKEKANG